MTNRKTTPNNKYIHWLSYYHFKGKHRKLREGYQVRIRNVPNVGQVQSWFGILTYGNKRAAFKAARLWRDAVLKELNIEHLLKKREWSKEPGRGGENGRKPKNYPK